MAKLRNASNIERANLIECIDLLKRARYHARQADTPNTLKRIAAALKSADGAQRHMERRITHATKGR